jgi:hypothetical protein
LENAPRTTESVAEKEREGGAVRGESAAGGSLAEKDVIGELLLGNLLEWRLDVPEEGADVSNVGCLAGFR